MTGKAVTKTEQVKNGLLPTPPMPADLPKAQLTDNARQVLMKRYVRRGDDGKPAENVEQMFWRVAYHVAKVEEQWEADVQERTVEYYQSLHHLRMGGCKRPGNRSTPVVTDNDCLVCAEVFDHRLDIPNQFGHRIFVNTLWLAALVVAPLVHGHDLKMLGECRHLLAPGIPIVGKAMNHDDQRPFA